MIAYETLTGQSKRSFQALALGSPHLQLTILGTNARSRTEKIVSAGDSMPLLLHGPLSRLWDFTYNVTEPATM